MTARKSLAVWKFASCDGCQLSLLDCEDELLPLAGQLDIAHFPEAGPTRVEGEYDLSIVEGSITTAEDARRIREIRAASSRLVTIGACAAAGGIQALRNFAEVDDFMAIVYAYPTHASCAGQRIPLGTTQTGGTLPHPGLPFGDYRICAQYTTSGQTYLRTTVTLQNRNPNGMSGSTYVDIPTTGGSSTAACPLT